MKKMMPENLAFSVKLIFMHKNWYSQNPYGQLSSNMYTSLRFFPLLPPHCAANDTQLTIFQEVEKTRIFTFRFTLETSSFPDEHNTIVLLHCKTVSDNDLDMPHV